MQRVRYMHCRDCGHDLIDPIDTLNGFCWDCRELNSIEARRHWTVLTPHKQGAMLFTKEFAREAAIGINNKGGLVK